MKINEIISSDNFKSNLLTSPNNTLIINTPGDLDWYKLGQQFPNLDKANPDEFGQGDSDMQVTLANPDELAQLKSTLNKLGIKWKDVGGTSQHSEIHTEEVEVSLHGDAKKGYTLSKIEVSGDERNAGQGTKAMQDIVDRMDREGAVIALTPDDAFGGNKNRLIKFYKRFGFVPNKGRNKDFRFRETMIRYPQTNESVNEDAMEIAKTLMSLSGEEIVALSAALTMTVPVLKGLFKTGKGIMKVKRMMDRASVRIANGIVKEDRIDESLDNPYPFNFTGPDTSTAYLAKAQTPNGELVMEFKAVDYDDFSIDFAVADQMGKTDAGDAFRVFATVGAMMNKWISVVGIEHVEGFDFAANKEEHAADGRARLYTRFAKSLATQLGWKLQQSTIGNGSTAFFRLKNPKPTPRPDGYFDAIYDGKLGPNGEIPAEYTESVVEAEDTLTLPTISVGDEVLVGKFKNRKAEVKGFGKDDHNQPVLKTTKGDQKLFKPRLSKLMRNL